MDDADKQLLQATRLLAADASELFTAIAPDSAHGLSVGFVTTLAVSQLTGRSLEFVKAHGANLVLEAPRSAAEHAKLRALGASLEPSLATVVWSLLEGVIRLSWAIKDGHWPDREKDQARAGVAWIGERLGRYVTAYAVASKQELGAAGILSASRVVDRAKRPRRATGGSSGTSSRRADRIIRFAVVGLFPIAAVVAVVGTNQGWGRSTPPVQVTATPRSAPVATPLDPARYGQPVSTTVTFPAVPAQARNLCAMRPTNGATLVRTIGNAANGHVISVRNDDQTDAIVKIRDSLSGRVVASFFVVRGLGASISHIPDGTYRIQFGFGDAMTSDCRDFVDPRPSEFEGTERLATTRTGNQIFTQELSYTLFAVAGGNAEADGITRAEFMAP